MSDKGGMPHQVVVQVLLLRRGDHWVAQGLEYDVAAQGATISAAKEAFMVSFIGRLHFNTERYDNPLQGLDQAPAAFWDMYKAATRHKTKLAALKMDRNDDDPNVPPAFMIPAIAQQPHHLR